MERKRLEFGIMRYEMNYQVKISMQGCTHEK